MGRGYWILVWDDWGTGLVMINPRMHIDGKDFYGNPRNWWHCEDNITEEEIIEKHGLEKYRHYQIIF